MFVILQRQFNNQPQNQGADPAAFLGILCFYGVFIAASIAIQVFFLLTLSKCFKEISPRNRQMEPGQVWLCLIPLFGFVWLIITILRLADSLRNEYEDRGLHGDGDYGKTLGIVYVVSAFVCPFVTLVCFIMYWLKVAGYTRELRESRGGRGESEDEDRPSRRRRRDDDRDDRDDRDDDRPARRDRDDY